MNIRKKQQGITLIALAVTIIVMLILAGVTIAALSGDNGILKKSNDAKSEGTVPEVSTVQEQLSQSDYYTVKKGDTLASISKKTYGDTGHVDAICKMNGLSDGNLIFIGQKLLLP